MLVLKFCNSKKIFFLRFLDMKFYSSCLKTELKFYVLVFVNCKEKNMEFSRYFFRVNWILIDNVSIIWHDFLGHLVCSRNKTN